MNGIYYPVISEPSGFVEYDGVHKKAIINHEGIASAQMGRTLFRDWDYFLGYGHKSLSNDVASDSYADIVTIGSVCFITYHFTATDYAEWQLQLTGLPKPPVDICDYREFGNTLGLGYIKVTTDGKLYTYTKTQKKRISGILVYPIDTDASEYKNVISRYAYSVQRTAMISNAVGSLDSFNSALNSAMSYFRSQSYTPRYLYFYTLSVETKTNSLGNDYYVLMATIRKTNVDMENEIVTEIEVTTSSSSINRYDTNSINSANTAVNNKVFELFDHETDGYYYIFNCTVSSASSNQYGSRVTPYRLQAKYGIPNIDQIVPMPT